MSEPAFPKPVVVTHDRSLTIGRQYVQQALTSLADNDPEHAAVWLETALIWLRPRQTEHAHPDTMIGQR